jgi:PAS domain S-box-containing protein
MGNSLADSTAFRRRLRTAVWASWLAPYALFCLFAATSSSASQFTLIARLGPATFAAMLGSTLAAAVCLSRITNGSTFLRVAAVAVSLHTLFVATVAFYDADMNLHASATSVAVLVAIAVLYGTTLSVPFMLASADLHARNLGSPLPLSQTARHWLPVGGVGLAGGLVLVLALAMPSGSWFGVALLGVSLLAFAGVAATLATRASAADLAVAHDRERAAAGEHEDRVKRILMFAESITDYFFELDAELRVSGISERFTELTGFEAHEIIGRSVLDPLRESPDPEAGAHIETLLAHRPYRGFRFELTTKDGRTLHLQASAVPFFDKDGAFAGYRGCGADTTPMIEARRQLRRKEAELMQAQKMEAVGQLTGGLAHDFNNLLSAMVGNLELLKLRTDGDPTCTRYVDSALEAAARAAALTNRLLAFSRRQALSPRVVDVLALLRDMEDLMRRTLGEHVSIRIDAADDLTGCIVDSHQLENAVLNIAINARDAMREGGEIVISADNFTGARNAGRGHDAGRYVRIAISDNGAGIAPDVLPHVCAAPASGSAWCTDSCSSPAGTSR